MRSCRASHLTFRHYRRTGNLPASSCHRSFRRPSRRRNFLQRSRHGGGASLRESRLESPATSSDYPWRHRELFAVSLPSPSLSRPLAANFRLSSKHRNWMLLEVVAHDEAKHTRLASHVLVSMGGQPAVVSPTCFDANKKAPRHRRGEMAGGQPARGNKVQSIATSMYYILYSYLASKMMRAMRFFFGVLRPGPVAALLRRAATEVVCKAGGGAGRAAGGAGVKR